MVDSERNVYLNKFKKGVFGTFASVCVFLILAILHLDSMVNHLPLFENDQTLVLNSQDIVTPSTTTFSGLYNAPARLTDAVSVETGRRNVTMETASSCRPSSEYEERVAKIKGVTVYPEDIMALKPFKFLKNYKNPCFLRKNRVISCFPYYLLAGAPKSGTTDLSRRIIRHPQVSSMVRKGLHWLTRSRFHQHERRSLDSSVDLRIHNRPEKYDPAISHTVGFNKKLKSYPSIYKYVDQFFPRAARDILQSVKGSFHPKVVGDCSASTLWDNTYWPLLEENKNRSEPLHTTADFIHHINPNAKILAILRNPIDRLYSDYLYFKSLKNTKDFHAGVQKAISYYNECFQRCSYRHCLYTTRPRKMVRLDIGLYYYSIADYMKAFPRNQILAIKMEDYAANLTHYMRKVFTFLELDPVNDTQMAVVTDTRQIFNQNRKAPKVGPMLPETRTLLYNFYKPYNDKLEQLLGAKFWEDEAF